MKTSELTGAALDWAVANKCEGVLMRWERSTHDEAPLEYSPSTDWAQGGGIFVLREQIIEREKIGLKFWGCAWDAMGAYENDDDDVVRQAEGTGETPLIAAMRCYVASKLGDEVELPEELK
jgi:hypothetical protein